MSKTIINAMLVLTKGPFGGGNAAPTCAGAAARPGVRDILRSTAQSHCVELTLVNTSAASLYGNRR